MDFTPTYCIEQYKQTQNSDWVYKVYSPLMPLVYGTCLKYLKNRELAQDAVMAIFEKLSSDLLRLPIPEQFAQWLYVVAKNHCLMQLRSEKSQSKRFEEYTGHVVMESEFDLHPMDENTNAELEAKLMECIEKLKLEQKQTIELFYFSKMCYHDISETLHISEKNVKSFIQNGKRNLKICIENSGL